MITVAGFNTAIDRLLRVGKFAPGKVMRADHSHVSPGGKGVHVAQALAVLGKEVQLIGLVDEAHAAFLTHRLAERGVSFIGVPMPGDLRTCLAIVEADGRTSEVLERGPAIATEIIDALLEACRTALPGSRALVMSGSLPTGMAADTYARLCASADIPCVVDASGETLFHASRARPYLLKPNGDEAAHLIGRDVTGIDDAIAAARHLLDSGVAHPVVTLGAEGAVAVDAQRAWHATLALDAVRNTVGSGDCFLAGITAGLLQGDDLAEALRLGVACGAANALNEETGWMDNATVSQLLPRVTVRSL
ncbi:1-phosphofructokinase family hexose kinase [Pinirhizobacter sp.]|jgi:tagatose 6-phosphate kinase|uniref:1-phosphofructokinase family hexose kinase n=1 Tax=Pinirhizobacter sp. TaxID=2950432 RepID=UPI002F3E4508